MKTLTTAAAAAALTAALTGCAGDTVAGPAAAPVTTSATAAAETDRVIGGVWVGDDPAPLPAVAGGGGDLDAAVRLGMDRDRAATAATAGYPYVATVNGDGRDCPLLVRMPSGALWWSPPMVTVTGAGTAMTALPADAAAVPAGCVTPSGPPASGPVDAAARDAALAAGRPYISADGGDDVDGCHVTVRLPGGEKVGLDDIVAGTTGGSLMGGLVHMHGCSWR